MRATLQVYKDSSSTLFICFEMILVLTYYLILPHSVPVDLEIENNSTQLEHVLEGDEQEFVLGNDLANEILRTNEEFPSQVLVLYTVGLKKSYSFFNTRNQTPKIGLLF